MLSDIPIRAANRRRKKVVNAAGENEREKESEREKNKPDWATRCVICAILEEA